MDFTPDQVVCVKGSGVDAPLHFHDRVARITKTMIVLKGGRRFSRESLHRSIPYQPYGGAHVSTTCQKKETK
jgi:hypothetical protein